MIAWMSEFCLGTIALTTQSSCRFMGGTSRPSSSAAAHGCDNTLSTSCAMACVRTSTDHDRLVTVSYSIMFPKWHLPSAKIMHQRGYPIQKLMDSDHIPALHGISSQCTAREHTIARAHRNRIRSIPYVGDVVSRRLNNSYKFTHLK
jgi:hypothetical protein